jgi:hypothetical protein
MARTLEHKVMQPGRHPEVHPDIHPDVHPDVDDFIRRTLDEHETGRPTRRPVRWMRWLAAGFIALVGVGVAIWALPGEETEYAVPRTADGTERWLEYATPEYAVPRTADGTERWLEYATPEYAVPRTADGTERWLEYATPEYAVPRTADGTVRWMTYTTDFAVPSTADGTIGWYEYLTPNVPRTADGAEGWILATAAPETPALIQFMPITQVPEGLAGDVTYLPVTQPRLVAPDAQVVLTVQPVFLPAT